MGWLFTGQQWADSQPVDPNRWDNSWDWLPWESTVPEPTVPAVPEPTKPEPSAPQEPDPEFANITRELKNMRNQIELLKSDNMESSKQIELLKSENKELKTALLSKDEELQKTKEHLDAKVDTTKSRKPKIKKWRRFGGMGFKFEIRPNICSKIFPIIVFFKFQAYVQRYFQYMSFSNFRHMFKVLKSRNL